MPFGRLSALLLFLVPNNSCSLLYRALRVVLSKCCMYFVPGFISVDLFVPRLFAFPVFGSLKSPENVFCTVKVLLFKYLHFRPQSSSLAFDFQALFPLIQK